MVMALGSNQEEQRSSNGERTSSDIHDPEKQLPQSSNGATARKGSARRDPFEDESSSAVQYKTLDWWQAALLMIAETVSLGILSLPSVVAALGLVPSIILILGLGAIATYTGYVLGQFKQAYPHIVDFADAGEILLGSVGREVFGAAQTIFLIFAMASHVLTFTIAFNVMTGHATCTIVWSAVALVVFWLCTLPRTLKHQSYFSIAAFISIVSAVMITMIGVGIQRPGNGQVSATVTTSLASGFLSVSNIIFAYTGHVAFFGFIAEMKHSADFPKALFALQSVDVSLYLTVAIVVYRYAGTDVASPALGSLASPVNKIAYGIALPTIAIAGVIYGHVASKYIYLRLFRGTKHLGANTALSIGAWAAITLAMWTVAWVIAESIPTFNTLLALISSLFSSWFTYGLAGVFWLWMNWHGLLDESGRTGKFDLSTWRKRSLAALNVGLIVLACAIMGLGLYASGTAIHDAGGGGSWTCADNSKS